MSVASPCCIAAICSKTVLFARHSRYAGAESQVVAPFGASFEDPNDAVSVLVAALGRGRGLAATLIGLTIGIIGALVLAPFLGSVLNNVRTRDPFLMTLAATIPVLVALVASAIPARRAAHIDPIAVLRGD